MFLRWDYFPEADRLGDRGGIVENQKLPLKNYLMEAQLEVEFYFSRWQSGESRLSIGSVQTFSPTAALLPQFSAAIAP